MPGVLTSWAVWGCLGNMFSHGYSFKKSEIWFISFPWFYGHRFITAIHVLLFFLGAHGPLFFFVGDIWPNLTLCVTGELWPFESIIDLRVWLGWSGASTVRWILQTAEACCFFVFLSTNNWSKSSKVLGFTGQGFIQHIWFFVEATPKTRKQQHGLCNDFSFFPPYWFSEDGLFFGLRKQWRFLVALLLWHGPSAHPVLCGDL